MMFQQRIRAGFLVKLALVPLSLALGAAQAAPPSQPTAAPPSEKRAVPVPDGVATEFVLRVPNDAAVWFDDARMESTGVERRFTTPLLRPDKRCYYDVKVRWREGSRIVERQRRVSFRPGARIALDFVAGAQTRAQTGPFLDAAELRAGESVEGTRMRPRPSLLIDPAAPAPWREDYYYDRRNWPNYPNLRRFGYVPLYVTPW